MVVTQQYDESSVFTADKMRKDKALLAACLEEEETNAVDDDSPVADEQAELDAFFAQTSEEETPQELEADYTATLNQLQDDLGDSVNLVQSLQDAIEDLTAQVDHLTVEKTVLQVSIQELEKEKTALKLEKAVSQSISVGSLAGRQARSVEEAMIQSALGRDVSYTNGVESLVSPLGFGASWKFLDMLSPKTPRLHQDSPQHAALKAGLMKTMMVPMLDNNSDHRQESKMDCHDGYPRTPSPKQKKGSRESWTEGRGHLDDMLDSMDSCTTSLGGERNAQGKFLSQALELKTKNYLWSPNTTKKWTNALARALTGSDNNDIEEEVLRSHMVSRRPPTKKRSKRHDRRFVSMSPVNRRERFSISLPELPQIDDDHIGECFTIR